MSAKHVLVGTVSGIVAGAVVGLLLAPQSGADTRHKIADSVDGLKRKLRRLKNRTTAELDDLADVFKKEISGLDNDVREKVLRLIDESKSSIYNIKKEAES